MTFLQKTLAAIKKFDSLLCVGIDPDLKKIPAFIWEKFGRENITEVLVYFCTKIIDATAPFCAAFKLNAGFFEAHLSKGIAALEQITNHIKVNHPDHILIIDGKRGDIGNSAAQCAEFYAKLGADAGTVNPYLGPDALQPFLDANLGIFVLCVTSNKDAATFQNLNAVSSKFPCGGQPVYIHVARELKDKFGQTEQLGLVTGATHPTELGEIRKQVGNRVVLLIPGIGKQGGDIEATVKNNGDGPAVINNSRGIIFASSNEDFAEAAGREAEKTKDEINRYIARF